MEYENEIEKVGEEIFKCNICDHSPFYKIELNEHVVSVHKLEGQFKCYEYDYSSFRHFKKVL